MRPDLGVGAPRKAALVVTVNNVPCPETDSDPDHGAGAASSSSEGTREVLLLRPYPRVRLLLLHLHVLILQCAAVWRGLGAEGARHDGPILGVVPHAEDGRLRGRGAP